MSDSEPKRRRTTLTLPTPALGAEARYPQSTTLALHRTPTDHIDSAVVDESEHHPLDTAEEEQGHDEDEERASGISLTTTAVPVEANSTDRAGDAEKGFSGGTGVDNAKSRQSQKSEVDIDPAVREWKDDIVTFDTKSDPNNPKNFRYREKVRITMLYGVCTMCSTFASSVFSSASTYIQKEFGISQEVAILGISLFVLGYVPGPLLFAPISELYGRKASIIVPMFVFICLSAATATAKDTQTVFITRFFAGVMASAPVTNVGGVLADMYDQRERGTAVVFYSLAVVTGPTLGPIIGGAVSQSYLGWRWTEYLVVILTSVILLLVTIFIPETFAPVLMTRKARTLRLQTGRWALHSRHEMTERSIKVFLQKNLFLPVRMIFTEPLVTCLTIYNSFAYGILYMLFSAIPIIYEEGRGWNTLVGALPFLALGTFIAAAINIAYSRLYFQRYLDKNGGSCPPELRLPPMMVGSVTFPIGFFLVGWTSDPSINWFPSVVGFVFIGMSFLLIFQAGLNMLIDSYTSRAASAVAANTFMRSIFAAVLPFTAPPMFHNLGVDWACTLLGCIAVLLAGIPFLFYRIGPTLRARSKLIDRKD